MKIKNIEFILNTKKWVAMRISRSLLLRRSFHIPPFQPMYFMERTLFFVSLSRWIVFVRCCFHSMSRSQLLARRFTADTFVCRSTIAFFSITLNKPGVNQRLRHLFGFFFIHFNIDEFHFIVLWHVLWVVKDNSNKKISYLAKSMFN